MASIAHAGPSSLAQPLPPVAPSSRSGSSLRLTAFAYYIQNHPELFGLLQYDKIEFTKDICALVNGEQPKDVQLLSALQLAAARVSTAVADLLSRNESISALTIQKIDEVEANQTHATGVLYQDLREQRLIPGEPSSNIEVQRTAIAAVNVAEVTMLDLSRRELRCVPEELSRFTALVGLRLEHNQLTSLPPGIFDNMTALKYLYLSHNQLTDLPPGIFDKLTALGILYLGFNQFTSLPPGIFDNLTVLTGLVLNYNQLTNLPPEIFANMTDLEVVWLQDNPLLRKVHRCLVGVKVQYV